MNRLLRRWHAWRARSFLFAEQVVPSQELATLDYELKFPELEGTVESPVASIKPYEGLAYLWKDRQSLFRESYHHFISTLTRLHGLPFDSCLELGCGHGHLARRLAKSFDTVQAIDLSESMIRLARETEGNQSSVTFLQGDFRSFHFPKPFSVVACVFNSINYLNSYAELNDILKCVDRHLNPGGLFFFDTTTSLRMHQLNGFIRHEENPIGRIAMKFQFDPFTEKETVTILTRFGVETHHRMAIDLKHVKWAIQNTSLRIYDVFSHPIWHGLFYHNSPCYFVLKKAG